jgi:hypothetical protein
MWPPNQKAGCVTHRAEIGADVARVGGEYEKNDELRQPVGVVFAKIAGDAAPRGSADAAADLLDRGHQRIAEEHRPADSDPSCAPACE